MRNDQGITAIKITDQLSTSEFITYELQIHSNNELLIYQTRYSQLRKLFGKLGNDDNPFPSKDYLTSFFKPLIPSKFRQCNESARYEGMKKFFQILSNTQVLTNLPEFQKLKNLAQQSQRKALKPKNIKGRSWQKMLERKSAEAKSAYALIF